MRYHHKLGAEEISQSDSTSFLLARKVGGYLSLGLPNVTRYQGLCTVVPWQDSWELLKSIESITINDTPEAIILLPDSVERMYTHALERFSVQQGAISYAVTQYTGPVRIALDMRFIHDFEIWGRSYTIQDVPGGHVITYSCPRYSFCLAVLGAKARYTPTWKPVVYSYDASRSAKADFSIFECLEYTCVNRLSLRFGIGWTPAAAMAQANNTASQEHDLTTSEQDAAFQAAVNDLDGLTLSLPRLDDAIFAGYPWFYQVYTRDEAISVGALIRLGDTERAKRIVLRQLHYLHSDGRISNRFPGSELSSADGVGWTFLRLHELYHAGALSHDEQVHVHAKLTDSLRGLQEHHMHDGLFHNNWKETWMDTTGGYEDGRQGCRIEIQGLGLRMYRFMAELCEALKDGDSEYYKRKEEVLAANVREKLYDVATGSLADGIADHVDRTARPNIFLAAYAYPQLFSHQQWQHIYRYSLQRLWLPWGGLATIDKEHLLFTPTYTGENDKSYHRGDSWYFVNNIAAMCLAKQGFISEAEKILAASKDQLLSKGIPGHAAETSSAKEPQGVGCYSQAWSAATYIELWLTMKEK